MWTVLLSERLTSVKTFGGNAGGASFLKILRWETLGAHQLVPRVETRLRVSFQGEKNQTKVEALTGKSKVQSFLILVEKLKKKKKIYKERILYAERECGELTRSIWHSLKLGADLSFGATIIRPTLVYCQLKVEKLTQGIIINYLPGAMILESTSC